MLYWMCVCVPVYKCIYIWYSAWACVCAFMCGCGCVSLGSARIMQSDSEIWHVINPLKHFHCLSSLPQCTNALTHKYTHPWDNHRWSQLSDLCKMQWHQMSTSKRRCSQAALRRSNLRGHAAQSQQDMSLKLWLTWSTSMQFQYFNFNLI